MLQNYLKIFSRQLLANKVNSLANIGGLTIGIVAVLLIGIYLKFTLSFDGDLSQSEQIYRLNLTSSVGGDEMGKSARTSPAMGMHLAQDVSDIESFSRFVIMGEVIAGFDEDYIRELQIFLTDANYFDFYDLNLKAGTLQEINEPLTAYLSESTAQKIFQEVDPIGKTLKINSTNFDGTVDFQVAGVFENIPENRHLRPEILVSYATLNHFIGDEIDQSFDWLNQYTFLKVNESADLNLVTSAVNQSLQRHYGEQLKKTNTKWELDLQPVTDIHTNLDYAGEYTQGVDGQNLKYFIWIGVFVLLMVYLNSINIANTKAINRLREIGVRKVSGGSRSQLIIQFLFESLMINLMAIVLGWLIVFSFGGLINKSLDLGLSADSFAISSYWPWLLALWVGGTLASGFYPALLVSSYAPAKSLKGNLKIRLNHGLMRPFLVLQLVFCLVIISGVLTIYKQLGFMRSQHLGIELADKIVVRSPMLFVEGSGNYQEKMKSTIGSLAQVKGIAAANEIPGNEVYWRSDAIHIEGKERNGAMFSLLHVSTEYFELFNLDFLAGKIFNPKAEGEEAIINQRALEALGFEDADAAIGKQLQTGNGLARIAGVVENYYQEGVNSKVEPMILSYSPGDLNYYILDTEPTDRTDELIAEVGDVFRTNFPQSPFEYYFIDEHFDKQYKSEKQFVKIFGLASLVAIVVAIMGIFGVTSQFVLQKNKEISIRKILGATGAELLGLISGEYGIWLSACFLLGIPLSYFVFSGWLQEFPISVSLGWWFYLLPAFMVCLIFLSASAFQTLRAVLINPAALLKNDE
ncbi:ABC transporter permease [Algoriphagus namhaensis]|uniref:ABC transporter permease n=1 Tax=Algoriphagus namhaensis TaxID=915353 RepID=A0ABV8AY41_9BACT